MTRPKVVIIQVIYNTKRFIEPVFSAIFKQTYKNFNVVAVISGNEDGSKEVLLEKFPQVEIIDPGYNIGFAKGHNLVFEKNGYPSPASSARETFNSSPKLEGEEGGVDYFQLVNPDMIMEPDYVEKMVEAMEKNKNIGAATGKLYKISELGIMNFELWKTENNIKYSTLVSSTEQSFNFPVKDGNLFNSPPKSNPPSNSPLKVGHLFNFPPKLGGARGGMILDTTGVVIKKSGRAFDRGQHEIDVGQYDKLTDLQAVSAAGAMYRASALQATSYKLKAEDLINPSRSVQKLLNRTPSPNLGEGNMENAFEYFDEDFHSYWEDVDLTWRMTNKGWKCAFVPSAIGFHGRGASSSRGGYFRIFEFVRHHRKLNPRIRQLNFQNHIFMYLKNSPHFYLQFFIREFFMFLYILFFEISTFKILPKMIKLLPKIWRKRKS